mgnify:CR=1 FL=1
MNQPGIVDPEESASSTRKGQRGSVRHRSEPTTLQHSASPREGCPYPDHCAYELKLRLRCTDRILVHRCSIILDRDRLAAVCREHLVAMHERYPSTVLTTSDSTVMQDEKHCAIRFLKFPTRLDIGKCVPGHHSFSLSSPVATEAAVGKTECVASSFAKRVHMRIRTMKVLLAVNTFTGRHRSVRFNPHDSCPAIAR